MMDDCQWETYDAGMEEKEPNGEDSNEWRTSGEVSKVAEGDVASREARTPVSLP
jgi:hypothetical protein